MRLPLLIALFFSQVVFAPGRSQEYTVTAQGVTGTGYGIFSSFPQNTPFSLTFQFNLATAVPTQNVFPLGPTASGYVDPSGSATFQADTLSYAGNAPVIQVFSGAVGAPGPSGSINYGYALTETLPSGYAFEILLLGTDSSIAPTTGLNSIRTVPLSEFGPQGTPYNGVAVGGPGTSGDLFGSVTSFNVDVVAIPEPSSLGLALLAAVGFFVAHRAGFLVIDRRYTRD